MILEDARVSRYDLTLRRAWTTAEARATTRSGVLLWLRSEEGTWTLGDCAPPPGREGDVLARFHNELERLAQHVVETRPRATPDPPVPLVANPVRHAWNQAVLTLAAQAAGEPLHARLRTGDLPPARRRVGVNATLPLAGTQTTVASARAARKEGYACLKVKVGPSPREVQRLRAVRTAIGPDVRLRADANGSWTFEHARRMTDLLAPANLEYIEQPLPPTRTAELVDLHRESPVPLAIDESAGNAAHAQAAIRRRAIDYVVLKPMALGGLDRAVELVQAARRHGVRAVVTDSLESAVGRTGALHVAALLGPRAPACGLASGEWLARDVLANPLHVRRGHLPVPRTPGLGLVLEPPAVEATLP